MHKVYKFIKIYREINGLNGEHAVVNKRHNAPLGTIQWYAPRKLFAFTPDALCLFSADCLADIIAAINKITDEMAKTDMKGA